MLIYKQRYKPRTTRAFTKSDLTVYDSAGNTALNALTVYGKSEVVDGSIISAGEGYAVVDLGTLDWNTSSTPESHIFRASLADVSPAIKQPANAQVLGNYLCGEYLQKIWGPLSANDDGCYGISNDAPPRISIIDYNYNNVADFIAHISGVMLAYEIVDPTQSNAIAVKTDDGTGINGTMAVFSTGTPLRGIPNGAKDVAEWDGSTGTVIKNCAKVNASTLTWSWNEQYSIWTSNSLANLIKPSGRTVLQSFMVTSLEYTGVSWADFGSNDKTYTVNTNGGIGFKDSDYDSTKSPDFDIIYEIATPITTPLTTAENDSIAALRTFTPQTHAQNNAQTEMTINYTIRVPTI